jgi:hypothetical protein
MISVMVMPLMAFTAENFYSIQLTDVTQASGIDFVHTDGSSGKRFIVETVASGLATFDFNGDGLIDILFLNGAPLPVQPTGEETAHNALYQNEGDWKFTDVTKHAGLNDAAYHLGVCVGDYDNDGDPDLFLNNFGPNILYQNNGNGTFSNVTEKAGVSGGSHVGAGACFLDIEGDGDLDLFVANYVDFTFDNHHITHMNGFPAYVGPLNYPSTKNQLFRNDGNGVFTDISESSGIASLPGAGMGVVAVDIDNDRDTDIIVGNDLRPDFLLINDGKGHFKDTGALMGLAYDAFGNVQGSMGMEIADWNHDGWFDVYITPYQRQLPTLYENRKGAYFEDVARQTGAAMGAYADVKWGVGWVDFDNDLHKDIFIACGHLIDNVDQFDTNTQWAARNILLHNTGSGKFTNVSDQSGTGLLPKMSSRGAAFDDLDNDGDIDAVVLNTRSKPTLIRNESQTNNHWLQISLIGTKSPRDGTGARVYVKTGDMTQMDEVHSGRSYQSDFGKRLHFGLGSHEKVDRIEVRWTSGTTDAFQTIKADQHITLSEGKGNLE